MLKFHHLGIPTDKIKKGEEYLEDLKFWVSGYEESPYNIEWMRFEDDCPQPELIKTIPHIAFEVDDLDEAIQGKKVIVRPTSPSPGIKVAFIEDNGAPIEFLQIDRSIAGDNV